VNRFKFWKKAAPNESTPQTPSALTRFNVTPRQDTATAQAIDDPAIASKLRSLQRRRESLQQEVNAALDASQDSNRWRAEIALIDQAMTEIDADMEALPASSGPPGRNLDPLPISVISFTSEPVVSMQIQIGDHRFALAEDLDWAERGFQLARSDIHIDSGDFSWVSNDESLQEHLLASLIVYATDARDRIIEGEPVPEASLADLAQPSPEFGSWLDWHGNSPFNQHREIQLQAMRVERHRLEQERATLIEEEVKTAESLPFAQRRLREVEAEIESLTKG
jgi:hypothetical protein